MGVRKVKKAKGGKESGDDMNITEMLIKRGISSMMPKDKDKINKSKSKKSKKSKKKKQSSSSSSSSESDSLESSVSEETHAVAASLGVFVSMQTKTLGFYLRLCFSLFPFDRQAAFLFI